MNIYLIYVGAFFVLNILNTYFLTVQGLNRYIAPFKRTFQGEINAIIGNFAVLFLFVILLFAVFRNAKSRLRALLFFTIFLNLLVFALGIFNLYFGTAFSSTTLTIFYNPAGGIALGIVIEVFLELVLYWRIAVLIPFITLLIMYLMCDREQMKLITFTFRLKRYLSGVLAVALIVSVATFSYFQQFRETLPITSVKSTYAVQNLGVYPFYLAQLFGQDLELDLTRKLDITSEQKLAEAYQAYNKNRTSYVNFFDGKTYGNRLSTLDVDDNVFIDESILNGTELHGILAERNLVLIHLESLNYFMLQIPEINERLPFLNRLLDESLVLRNFYANVGMGVSADAELSVLAGLYPRGHDILFWEFNNTPYELNTMAKYFNQRGYVTKAIHGDTGVFYNRHVAYPELMGFDTSYFLEDFVEDGYVIGDGYLYDTENSLVHHSPWISDYHLADMVYQQGSQYIADHEPFMMFPVTMMPHTPFDYDPYGMRTDVFPQWVGRINHLTLKYINFVDYYDEHIMRFFIGDGGVDQTLDNTVYLFYSDHGAGLKNGDLSILFDEQLSLVHERQLLQQTLAFIYVPGDEVIDDGTYQIRRGLMTGEQHLVRSQVDLYRTVIELFDLPVGLDTYYGVHAMSTEPTFAIDNRLMDIVTDDVFFSMRNRTHTHPADKVVDESVYQYVLRFKLLSDLLLSTHDFQVQVEQAIRHIYG